ncbi:MAG: hypothetical protein ACJ768_01005 [Gaiellaceae bacterium]
MALEIHCADEETGVENGPNGPDDPSGLPSLCIGVQKALDSGEKLDDGRLKAFCECEKDGKKGSSDVFTDPGPTPWDPALTDFNQQERLSRAAAKCRRRHFAVVARQR